jgi:tRNA(Arg) A34 adenosine deaminase TadA
MNISTSHIKHYRPHTQHAHQCESGCKHSASPEALPSGPRDVGVSPGVVDVRKANIRVRTAAAAAAMATAAAVQAGHNGTFAVGGILLGPDKELVAISYNDVLSGGELQDPTAHGERQLIDWYFEQKTRGEKFPEAQDMTIVSSLDPCTMCGSSILKSGMNVEILSKDDTAGLDYKNDGEFTTLPLDLRGDAKKQFSYFGTDAGRPSQGTSRLFGDAVIPASTEQESIEAFLASLGPVKEQINNMGNVDPEHLRNPQQAPDSVKAALQDFDAQALSVKINPMKPGPELGAQLVDVATRSQLAGNSFDAAALVDPFGNVLMTVGGQESRSPIRTPFMELTRSYAQARVEAGQEGRPYLPHFKHCKVVTLHGPGEESTHIMELGAYGSSVEGPLPEGTSRHWQYVRPRQSEEGLEQTIDRLPPLYSKIIRPDIRQVPEGELLEQYG